MSSPKYPGIRITTNGNQLVAAYTEALIADAGVFYPITPSTEMGENFQLCFAKGQLNAFGEATIAIETEGEHAAQGGAIAASVTGKRVVNFTSGQGIVYGVEQYYHAPGKLSTMVLQVGARALTKHALNVHCGHDDIYSVMDTGWIMLFAKDAQQASDQAIILRRVTELSLNPGINIQDGFLTTHLERTFLRPEPELIREYLGHPADIIDTPTEGQKILFGPTRRRVPEMINLTTPIQLGPVQNQEHYMNGVAARRNNFSEAIMGMLEQAYEDFAKLTGRKYGFISTYNCEEAETVFVALGSAAENIEAACDYLKETRGENVGVVHINVIRPFPDNAIIHALRGKKRVIVLERTDESLASENPLAREIRVALSKSVNAWRVGAYEGIEKMDPKEMPQIFSGVYGLGSRDFRPEGVIGAYDFSTGNLARNDGKRSTDGPRFFYVGIDHPYAVESKETPSCLPKKAIAIRFHSIGGWGMITTGKNLSEIIGEFSNFVATRDKLTDEKGQPKEVVHVSANPKYGSEKKGSPTNYFLVAAPERVRVNCDLRHVSVVLCCDSKIFLHTDPLLGLEKGGAFVWEANGASPEEVWQRIPRKHRQEMLDKDIKLFVLDGFGIAKAATKREDLQTRMQGNAFLGAFFRVSSFLQDYKIPEQEFHETVEAQYRKKFGRFGDAVVASNMTVMLAGFKQVVLVNGKNVDAPDRSGFTGAMVSPCTTSACPTTSTKAPMFKMETFDKEFRAGLGYNQPSSALASVGMAASGTGATGSKYVSRRAIPKWIEANCTQCMECISVCPDTALPNTAQDISTLLSTAIENYVNDAGARRELLHKLPEIEKSVRATLLADAEDKDGKMSFRDAVKMEIAKLDDSVPQSSKDELAAVLDIVPAAHKKTKGIFQNKERKVAGSGGIFSIYVGDLCKGCAACVEACGDHEALVMVEEDDQIHANIKSAETFLNLLPDTPQEYLGMFDSAHPEDAKAATLRYHLMLQSKYKAFLSGDGACAGCGEKSSLRSVVTLTETYMRPVFAAKAARLNLKADKLASDGLAKLTALAKSSPEDYQNLRRGILHLILGLGGADQQDTEARIANEFKGSDADLINALVAVMRQDAFNHREPRLIRGELIEGMSVMAMAANTGCNSVFGSTPPNNPHPYPWMNSLFQDGPTIGWLFAESFIQSHARRSVLPERLGDVLLSDAPKFSEANYFNLTHFSDNHMTDLEVSELPKVWVTGGDGGMGDIGFQNLSKVLMQNRPNVKIIMLNTQVYSNTGGQNSEASVMTGGFDMNQAGPATEGKLTEMKSACESFLSGHGSPFIAQVSMANSATLYRAVLDGICYRGTAFFQVFTTCQPEHGVSDQGSRVQAQRIRDARGLSEFVFNPSEGERFEECLAIKGNPNLKLDWMEKKIPGSDKKYNYTVAHWAFTENRFAKHHKVVDEQKAKGLISLDEKLKDISMNDVVHRYYLNPTHPSYIPEKGVVVIDYNNDGTAVYHIISRQMVLFCVERRKAWRLLQSHAGVENTSYQAQREYLKERDAKK